MTSELERRVDDLENLDKDHPARPLIVRCLQDDPATRPSATELHQILLDIQQKYTGTDKVLWPQVFLIGTAFDMYCIC